MDPEWLGTSEWHQIVATVDLFWLFAAGLVVAALSFGLAHALIPSLLVTRQLHARAGSVRPVLYFVSLVAVVFAAVTLSRALNSAYSILRDFYPRFWV